MLLNNLPRISFYVGLIFTYKITMSNVIFLCRLAVKSGYLKKNIWTFCFLVTIFHFLDMISINTS